jgi:hypothetical protein
MVEKAYMGKSRAKMWTYVFVAVLVLTVAIIANLVMKNPEAAKTGVKEFAGLPTWLLATIIGVVGVGIYWVGLKVETDWPEFVGAGMVAGSIVVFEFVIGWKRIEMGLIVLPYIIPLAVFVLMMIIGMKKSV